MTKYAGKDFLLKLGSTGSPTEFTTVAGQRTTSFSINNEQIEVTDKDDSRWRKLIEGGVRAMSLSAAGILQDAQAHKDLLAIATTGVIRDYQVVFADGQTFTGSFLLTTVEGNGEYTDAQQYSITLESAGDIAYDNGA